MGGRRGGRRRRGGAAGGRREEEGGRGGGGGNEWRRGGGRAVDRRSSWSALDGASSLLPCVFCFICLFEGVAVWSSVFYYYIFLPLYAQGSPLRPPSTHVFGVKPLGSMFTFSENYCSIEEKKGLLPLPLLRTVALLPSRVGSQSTGRSWN